jgi:hypothetical protein
MIQYVIILILFIIGVLSTYLIFKKLKFIEFLGYSIFFSILFIPLVLINLSFIFDILPSISLLIIVSLITLGIVILFLKLRKIKLYSFKINKLHKILILFIFIITIFSFFYYNNSVYYLSLTSYMQKGETNCFYMLTFALDNNLDHLVSTDTPYDILSTPANSMFTSFLHPILSFNSFKFMYVIFQILLFIFTFLLIDYLLNRQLKLKNKSKNKFLVKLINKKVIPIFIALFAIFNPFNLYIEVLDRNFMALVVGIIFVYTLFVHKDKIILHAIIYGVLSGLGLRFLPLIFIIPVVIVYWKNKIPIKKIVLFLFIAFIIFGFNIPHLKYHGFNSVGETENYILLSKTALTNWLRTPNVAFPNLIYLSFLMLNNFGYFISLIILFGIFRLIRESKINFAIYSSVFILTLITLSIQRDFLESEKIRIIVMSFISLYVFLAYGIIEIIELIKREKFKFILPVLFVFLILFSLVNIFSFANFDADQRFYSRKLLYQKDNPIYNEYTKLKLTKIGFFPGYNKLGNKLNLKRKLLEQDSVLSNVLSNPKLNEYLNDKSIKLNDPKLGVNLETNLEYHIIKINFENLVSKHYDAVIVIDESKMADQIIFLDYSSELFDIYYKEFDVSWQNEKLPMVVFPKFSDTIYLDELYLDLNSFISYDSDELGFNYINSIHYKFYPESIEFAKQSSMITLPNFDDLNEITIKIPKNFKIVIRNWFVNGANAQPYKIDSWVISIKENNPQIEFWHNEPESYI